MTTSAERKALNEGVFRSANEELEEAAAKIVEGDTESLIPFLCECPTMSCIEVVLLALPEYEHVRADSRGALATPGHEDLEVERVVERNDRFLMTQKFGEAGEKFAATDPRGG